MFQNAIFLKAVFDIYTTKVLFANLIKVRKKCLDFFKSCERCSALLFAFVDTLQNSHRSDNNNHDDHSSNHPNHNEEVKSIHSSNHSPESAPREHFRIKQQSFECPSLHLGSDGSHTDDDDHLSNHSNHNEEVKSIHSSNHSPESAPREHFRIKQQSFECPSLHLGSDGSHTDDDDHLSHH